MSELIIINSDHKYVTALEITFIMVGYKSLYTLMFSKYWQHANNILDMAASSVYILSSSGRHYLVEYYFNDRLNNVLLCNYLFMCTHIHVPIFH